MPRLHIPCQVGGEAHVIVMSQMVALPAGVLGPEIANAAAERDRIVAAVDLLVSGF